MECRTKPRLQQRPERDTRRITRNDHAERNRRAQHGTGIDSTSGRHMKRGDLASIGAKLQAVLNLVEHVNGRRRKGVHRRLVHWRRRIELRASGIRMLECKAKTNSGHCSGNGAVGLGA